MAKKKTQRGFTLCTFCGKPASPVTWDDVFPKTLWAGPSKDRPLKVPSCKPCNNHSYEAILKHFFIVLDSRFYPETIKHFKNPKGKVDFRTFRSMWVEMAGNLYLYPDERVTTKFVKIFRGIRRHLMGDSWFFVPAERFLLFKVDKEGNLFVSRKLPMTVGGPNPPSQLRPDFAEALNEPMQNKFRDFNYGILMDDKNGMVLALRYEREEFAGLGNRLHLVCFVPTSA